MTVNGATRRFEDQTALVVGGANGIGKAIACRLAREGARIILADMDVEAMDRTAGEIACTGAQVLALECDVRESSQVDAMVDAAVKWTGRVDVLMQIAGVSKAVPFTCMDEAHWDWIMDTNLKGAYRVTRRLAPHMVRQRYGKLVFMSSTNSWDAEAGLAPYNVSKAGLYLLAKTLARELGPHGINSNAVAPGFIRTRLTEPFLKDPDFMAKYAPESGIIPLGRLGLPDDVAGPALFLASRDADYVTGALLFVDGGQLA